MDVTIYHCRLAIIRCGGWSWGTNRRELAHQAVRVLPTLIARRIAELIGDPGDIEIATPLRIDVPLSRRQLLDALADVRFATADEHAFAHQILSRVDAAIRQTVLPEIENALARSPNDTRQSPELELAIVPVNLGDKYADEHLVRPTQLSACRSLIQLLLHWRRENKLGPLLRQLSSHTLILWNSYLVKVSHVPEQALVRESDATAEALAGSASKLPLAGASTPEEIVQRIAAALPANRNELATILRYRISAAVEVGFRTCLAPGTERVQEALNSYFRVPHDLSACELPKHSTENTVDVLSGHRMESEDVARDSSDQPLDEQLEKPIKSAPTTARVDQQADEVHQRPPRSMPSLMQSQDVHIASALPFLILGPLADIGYLETVGASLEAAGMQDLGPAFGAALAYKVLDPPERGWRRSPEARKAASVMAGMADDLAESLLHGLSSRADEFVSALNAVLGHAVLAGHETNEPLYLLRVDLQGYSGFLLADVQGMFPCGFHSSPDEIVELLGQSDSSLVLVDANTATPSLLGHLHSQGHRFAVSVPPVRGEKWRQIKHKGKRWWTNDAVTPPPKIARLAARLSSTSTLASELLNAIGNQRPAIPNSDDQQLEWTLTLAAGLGLAQIAWDLWRDRETTNPLLTLERFADLDAHVRLLDEEVRVRLPLGRRSMDLSEHGLLRDVAGVPWLGNRTVTFSRG